MSSRSGLSSRMAKLNPFKRRAMREEDDEDRGEEIDADTVAGGGHTAYATDRARRELQLSDGVKSFLAERGIADDDALAALLEKHHIDVPAHVVDKSHPLPEYFISSSHNTYLMAHQLFGASSATAYEATLNAGARCVEIDAWDNADDPAEPKVTHGYTLVSNIPFRAVCETIRDVIDREEASSPGAAAPILLSLENHCDAAGQLRLVDIMKEVWGSRLLVTPVRDENPEAHVTLADLGSKVVVIVEHHIPDELNDSSSSSSSSSSESEDEKEARKDYKNKKKAAPPTIIIPELAALGVYAQSVKPPNDTWFSAETGLLNSPHHPLINVSESGLGAHLPANAAAISKHNSKHLMRVYPKGTRISSKNLHPEHYWGVGAQIVALNWQTFGTGMQLNEALFTDTAGFVLKPEALRAGGSGVLATGRNKTLKLVVGGAFDIAVPGDREAGDVKPYLTCSLMQPRNAVKQKTKALKDTADGKGTIAPMWDETLEWKYEETELEFLRMMIKSDDSYSSNPILAVAAVRLMYVVAGQWLLVPMLDLKGHQKGWLLVRFEVEDA